MFETAGERRLADHVLSGLESLLPHLIPRAQLPSQAQLAAYFPASRKPGTDDFMQTWVLVVTEEPLSSYTNLASQKLALHVPAEPPLAKTDNPLLLQAWKRAHEHLLQYEVFLDPGACFPLLIFELQSTNLLGLAYWRLGREAGNVVRILSSNHIRLAVLRMCASCCVLDSHSHVQLGHVHRSSRNALQRAPQQPAGGALEPLSLAPSCATRFRHGVHPQRVRWRAEPL